MQKFCLNILETLENVFNRSHNIDIHNHEGSYYLRHFRTFVRFQITQYLSQVITKSKEITIFFPTQTRKIN